MKRSRWLLVAGCLWALAVIGCNADAMPKARWQTMAHEDRVLYVKTLIGAEKAKDAKGGGGLQYARPAEDYVKRIDDAYARGDARDVPAIFAELGTK